MKWRKRIKQWFEVLRWAHGRDVKIPWLGLVRALLSGPVPRAVWRERLRYGCYRCILFNGKYRACSSTHPRHLGVGCSCYLPFAALTAQPYEHGCFGYETLEGRIGWPAYRWPSRWAKARAIICFILDIRY